MTSRRSWFGLTLMAAGWFAFAGCTSDSGENGGPDAGNQDCQNDQQCQAPDTCVRGHCKFVDPADNQVAGTFQIAVNNNGGTVLVQGKVDGKYLYCDLDGWATYLAESLQLKVEIFGVVTTNLLHDLVITVPKDTPLDLEIKFGSTGVATGILDEVTIDNNGVETGRVTKADAVGGWVKFSRLGLADNNDVWGELQIDFKAR
jgi:hypothetical protein